VPVKIGCEGLIKNKGILPMRDHLLLFCAAVLLLLASTTAARADVRVTKTEVGGVLAKTLVYEVRLGPNGFMQSIRIGGVEMLSVYEPHKTASMMLNRGGGGVGTIRPDRLVPAKMLKVQIRAKATVEVTYTNSTLTYIFREADFDLIPSLAKGPVPRFLMFPSADVLCSLDLQTDRAVSMSEGQVTAVTQEGMRWVTRRGPMLKFTERVDGVASFYCWQAPGGGSRPRRRVWRSSSPARSSLGSRRCATTGMCR